MKVMILLLILLVNVSHILIWDRTSLLKELTFQDIPIISNKIINFKYPKMQYKAKTKDNIPYTLNMLGFNINKI